MSKISSKLKLCIQIISINTMIRIGIILEISH